MKKILPFLTLILICALSEAQSSKGFPFQGYARDAAGEAMQNEEELEFRFSLFINSKEDPEFSETQTLDTDEYGVFQTTIGSVKSDDFNALDFSAYDYTLHVEIKDKGEYRTVGHKKLLSVPYAKAAERVADGQNGVPAGCIMAFGGEEDDIPSGWHLCDGTKLNKAAYPELYAAIKMAWGGTDTEFHLPNLQGAFLRGVDYGRGWDDDASTRISVNGGNTGDNVGTYEYCAIQNHRHKGTTNTTGGHVHGISGAGFDVYMNREVVQRYDIVLQAWYGHDALEANSEDWVYTEYAGSHTHSFTTDKTGGLETRPKNMAVNYIIKL